MKTGNEEIYKKNLKECIVLFDLETQKERGKIAIALEIGKKIDELLSGGFDKEAVFKRLTRDIFKARHKVVSLLKIAEYHQLYLDFGSMEVINSIEKTLLSDITMVALNRITVNESGRKGSYEVRHINPLFEIFQKVGRLLGRVEAIIDDHDLTGADVLEINGLLDGLHEKMQEISMAITGGENRGQVRLFGRGLLSHCEDKFRDTNECQ